MGVQGKMIAYLLFESMLSGEWLGREPWGEQEAISVVPEVASTKLPPMLVSHVTLFPCDIYYQGCVLYS